MAFWLIHAGTSLHAMRPSGTFVTLSLPSGVTISSAVRAQIACLAQRIIVARAPTVNLIINPADLSTTPLSIPNPATAPTLAAGSGTGLTGAYLAKVSFITKDTDGNTINETPLSPVSNSVTLTDQDLVYSNIPLPPSGSGATGRRLYRTTSDGAVFFAEVDIDDLTTTTYTSTLGDAGLSILPADPELGSPPGAIAGTGLRLLAAWRNRLWARPIDPTLGDKLLFSDDGSPTSWSANNFLLAQPKGEDSYGITGFMPRRDEFVFGKRTRILKVIGFDETEFEVVVVAEGVGILADDSCVVVRDRGYWLGADGVYSYGDEGITPISRGKVDPWFLTDTYFNRELFPMAIGEYNPVTDTYDLQLASAGSSTLDRYVSYYLRRDEWTGPHKIDAYTTTARALLTDDESQSVVAVGSSGGFVHQLNQSGAQDKSDANANVAIAIDWITKWFSAGAPDIFHFYGQPSYMTRNEGVSAGNLVVTPRVGNLDASNGTAQNIPLNKDRSRLPRLGAGRLARLEFTHSTVGEDVVLRGIEIPFHEIGRR